MANRTIALLLRVSINGKQPYLKPTLKNGKLRNKYTNYKGEDKHFPDGVYVLRYKQGSRLVFKTVGKALDAALMAQRRKEAELQAESAGLLIHSPQPALVEPKKPKTDITVAVDKFLDDVAMRDRVNTVSGYRFTLELFMSTCSEVKYLETVKREHCTRFVSFLLLLCYKRRTPQKGHWQSLPSKARARIMRRVAMELEGLCRCGRMRASGLEVRREFGRW